MPKNFLTLIGAVFVLGGCAASAPPITGGNVPLNALPQNYQDKPDIKALAYNPNGRWWAAWGSCRVSDAMFIAKSRCEANYGGPCKVTFLGPNKIDDLAPAAQKTMAQEYQAAARKASEERPFTPSLSVDYAMLFKKIDGSTSISTGQMNIDPANICRGTIAGKRGKADCKGVWESVRKEIPGKSYPSLGNVKSSCSDGTAYTATYRLTRRIAGRVTGKLSDGGTLRGVVSDRADLSNLSPENFELLWDALK